MNNIGFGNERGGEAVVNDGVKRMKKGLEYSERKQIINQKS